MVRAIESDMDYEQGFPKITGLNTDEINKAFNDIFNYKKRMSLAN